MVWKTKKGLKTASMLSASMHSADTFSKIVSFNCPNQTRQVRGYVLGRAAIFHMYLAHIGTHFTWEFPKQANLGPISGAETETLGEG